MPSLVEEILILPVGSSADGCMLVGPHVSVDISARLRLFSDLFQPATPKRAAAIPVILE